MRKLILHPDAVLRRRADSVDAIDDVILALVADMIQILKEEEGLVLPLRKWALPNEFSSLKVRPRRVEMKRCSLTPNFCWSMGCSNPLKKDVSVFPIFVARFVGNRM